MSGGNATGRAAWAWLVLPGMVALYALLGAVWDPLLIGPGGLAGFDCDVKPWHAVAVASFALGAVALLGGTALAVAHRPRMTGVAVLVSGLLLVAAGVLVGVVAGVNDYLVCPS